MALCGQMGVDQLAKANIALRQDAMETVGRGRLASEGPPRQPPLLVVDIGERIIWEAMPGSSTLRTARAGAEVIASRENRWLKRFRAALQHGEAEDGFIGVEGPRLVREALRSGLDVAALLVCPSGEKHLTGVRADPGAYPILRTSDRLFAGVADTQSPQGIAALVRPREWRFEELVAAPQSTAALVCVLVGIQDPGNVGTILRAAEAFGATGIIATHGTADPLAPKALRASAGSALRLPMLRGISAPVAMAQLRMAGLKLYAGAAENGMSPHEVDLSFAHALFIGNEGAGLPPEVLHSADALIHIPISRDVESLNAAMAASVLLYEAARQRNAT